MSARIHAVLLLFVTALPVVAGFALTQRLKIDWSCLMAAVCVGVVLLIPRLWALLGRLDRLNVALSFFAVAAVMSLLTLLVGEEREGAARWLLVTNDLLLRSGLWANIFFAAGLSVALGSRVIDGTVNKWIISAVVVTAGALLFSFATMPDMFSAMIFVGMLCGFALATTGVLKRWLLIVALLPVSLLAAMIFSSNYRGRRILEWANEAWLSPADGIGRGWAAFNSRIALENSSGFGLNAGAPPLILPPRVDWYGLSHLGFQFGTLSLGLTALCLMMMVALVLRFSSARDGAGKYFLVSVTGVFAANLIFSVAPAFGLLPYVGHYGIPFLGLTDITLLGVILVALAVQPSSLPIRPLGVLQDTFAKMLSHFGHRHAGR